MLYESEVKDLSLLTDLFTSAGLRPLDSPDYTVGLFDGGTLVGTGSLKGDIIMGVVIDEDRQGEGLLPGILTSLIREGSQRGLQTLYLFTKPAKAMYFQSLGFRLIASCPYAAMLEWGAHGLADYQNKLRSLAFEGSPEATAIVMNCNPFTRGHRYLAERAAAENAFVYIFAVEEDQSVFPFRVRYRLMREGLSDLQNVKVLPGGRYIVSQLTFPSYFTREADLAAAHAALDLTLFREKIAPVLNITARYVGTEPASPVTAVYNETMHKLLPQSGIRVCELERLSAAAGMVSASAVRQMLKRGDTASLRELVPDVTYDYLCSAEAKDVIQAIRQR